MQDQGKNLIFQHQNKSFTILSSKFALAIGIYELTVTTKKTEKTCFVNTKIIPLSPDFSHEEKKGSHSFTGKRANK